jgi:hypothetical protein
MLVFLRANLRNFFIFCTFPSLEVCIYVDYSVCCFKRTLNTTCRYKNSQKLILFHMLKMLAYNKKCVIKLI